MQPRNRLQQAFREVEGQQQKTPSITPSNHDDSFNAKDLEEVYDEFREGFPDPSYTARALYALMHFEEKLNVVGDRIVGACRSISDRIKTYFYLRGSKKED